MKDLNKLWEDALVEIEGTISQANFSTWFKDISILREEAGIVYIGVPNSFTQEWLKKKFHNNILSNLKGIDAEIVGVEYVIVKDGLEVCSFNDSSHHTRDILDELNQNVYGLNEKFESFISRFVILTNKTESLIGRVGMLTSIVNKSIRQPNPQ